MSPGSKDAIFDVLVVGLGPVGSLGAILFAEAGLKVAAIEKDADVYTLPRAVNLDGEIIRALQPIGACGDCAENDATPSCRRTGRLRQRQT